MDALSLTGRLSAAPSALVDAEVLEPQFRYEASHYLDFYLRIEKALLAEYARMELVAPRDVAALAGALDRVAERGLDPARGENMSDIAFALEQAVERELTGPVAAWHVDRSRNDLQACAQLMFGRGQIAATAMELAECAGQVLDAAAGHLDRLLPGYTHFQAAQVMTPGFYLSALADQLIHILDRLSAVYDVIDRCPLGVGAMTGAELAWDREHLAALLGFAGPQQHALVAVASRSWMLEAAAEASNFGIVVSRFATDLLAWSGSALRLAALPDELAGISSAMPQKKNYPILERIRGRSAHLTAFYVDIAMVQRATPFTNSVEASKEAGARLFDLFQTTRSVTRLLALVVRNLAFDPEAGRRVCDEDYLGGFSLANRLTLLAGVPWRQAQALVGAYIVEAVAADLPPDTPSPDLLARLAAERGFELTDPAGLLAGVFSAEHGLDSRATAGSARPGSVGVLVSEQREVLAGLRHAWVRRQLAVQAADARLDDELARRGRQPVFLSGAAR
jgi:argininosuccinate lyase